MMVSGTQLIREERLRQIEVEGYSAAHDSEHEDGALAAAAFHMIEAYFDSMPDLAGRIRGSSTLWEDHPWMHELYEKSGGVRALVVAGALIAAEIDRLNRMNGG